MNLKRRRRNKSTGARVCISIPTTPAAITSAPAVTTTAVAASGVAAAAMIPRVAVTTEPAVTAVFAAGIGAGRAVIAGCLARPFATLVPQHDPAQEDRTDDDDDR